MSDFRLLNWNYSNWIGSIVSSDWCIDAVLLLNTFKTRLKSARRRIAGTVLMHCWHVSNSCRCWLHSNSQHAARWPAERRRLFTRVFPVCQTLAEMCHYWPRLCQCQRGLCLVRCQCCARYYLEDSIFILKIQDIILSCISKVSCEKYLDKEEYTFWRYGTFYKILFVHCVRYSTRIISQPFVHLQGTIYVTWLHEITIILILELK